MQVVVYFMSAFLLIVVAVAIFRIFVRRDYQRKGRLPSFLGSSSYWSGACISAVHTSTTLPSGCVSGRAMCLSVCLPGS
jgi:hypothetical protein